MKFKTIEFTRKPVSVEDVDAQIPGNHPDLKGLPEYPVIDLGDIEDLTHEIDVPQFFIIVTPGPRARFVVDTQGYKYARYVAYINPRLEA